MSYIVFSGLRQTLAEGLQGKARIVLARNSSEVTRTPSVKVP